MSASWSRPRASPRASRIRNYHGRHDQGPLHPDAVREARRGGRPALSSWRCSIISPTRACRCRRAIKDRDGVEIQELEGRPACLIKFLPGVSLSHPTPAQAPPPARALGRDARARWPISRRTAPTRWASRRWRPLFERCGRELDAIAPGLYDRCGAALDERRRDWPRDLAARHDPRRPVPRQCADARRHGHRADRLLFRLHRHPRLRPRGDAQRLGIRRDGRAATTRRSATRWSRLCSQHSAADRRGARARCRCSREAPALRFLLTRAWDWLNTPADALVTRKDPLAYLRRLRYSMPT